MSIFINTERLVQIFLDLVQIDAVSLRERPVVDYILNFIKKWDLPWVEDQAGEKLGGNAGNVMVHVHNHKQLEPIFLCAHTDTVRPTKGLTTKIRDGVIFSDGTTILGADNRAGVAILLYVLEHVFETRYPHRPFDLIFTIAEEIGLLGAAHLDAERLPSRMGFVFDSSLPPGNYIATTPSAVRLLIELQGKAAHAGVAPEKGINAISMAAEVLQAFPVGRVDDQTVANIGTIRGGDASNVVPASVRMEGEIRSFNSHTIDRLVQGLENTLSEVARKYGGSYTFDYETHFQGFSIAPDHDLTRRLKQKMEKLGLVPTPKLYHGGSDANIFNAMGRTTINLGIGARNPHGNDEHIAISDLETSARLALALIEMD